MAAIRGSRKKIKITGIKVKDTGYTILYKGGGLNEEHLQLYQEGTLQGVRYTCIDENCLYTGNSPFLLYEQTGVSKVYHGSTR
jgi:hypothetical protein